MYHFQSNVTFALTEKKQHFTDHGRKTTCHHYRIIRLRRMPPRRTDPKGICGERKWFLSCPPRGSRKRRNSKRSSACAGSLIHWLSYAPSGLCAVRPSLFVRRLGIWAVLVQGATLSEAAWRKRLLKASAWLLWLVGACPRRRSRAASQQRVPRRQSAPH